MSTLHKVRLAFVLCLLCHLCGCGSGNDRSGIEGTVTLDGEPVHHGTIAFLPIEGTQSPSAGDSIKNGRYSISAAKGPMVGVYRVEITSSRSTGKRIKLRDLPGQPYGADAQGDMEETVEAVPVIYNKKSTLRIEVHSGNNTHNFDLVSQPK